MSRCSNSRGKRLTSRGLQSGLTVSILVFFPLPPSSVAHDLVGGAAPCSRVSTRSWSKSQWLPPRSSSARVAQPDQLEESPAPGECWVSAGCLLCGCLPTLRAVAEPCVRALISGMGCSCLGSTRGQNGGIGFEKENCVFFFKQQKGKLKDWDLPSSLRH